MYFRRNKAGKNRENWRGVTVKGVREGLTERTIRKNRRKEGNGQRQ